MENEILIEEILPSETYNAIMAPKPLVYTRSLRDKIIVALVHRILQKILQYN